RIRPHRSAHFALSLPDALPIYVTHVADAHRQFAFAGGSIRALGGRNAVGVVRDSRTDRVVSPTRPSHSLSRVSPSRWAALPVCQDRKSTRLNSSHVKNSYAVFC